MFSFLQKLVMTNAGYEQNPHGHGFSQCRFLKKDAGLILKITFLEKVTLFCL